MHIEQAGCLRFTVQERTFGADGGTDIRVYGPRDGRDVQLLRFDCFRLSPHYHLDPDGRDEHHGMTPDQAADAVGWTLVQLRTSLPDMLGRAGCDPEGVQAAEAEAAGTAIERLAGTLGR